MSDIVEVEFLTTLELGRTSPNVEGGDRPAVFFFFFLFLRRTTAPIHARCSVSLREVFRFPLRGGGLARMLSSCRLRMPSWCVAKAGGERHGVSGQGLGIPLGYVVSFAPRSTAEVETVGEIARAAPRYGLEGKTVK